MTTTHEADADRVGPDDVFFLKVWDRLGELPGTDTDEVRREELWEKAVAGCGGRNPGLVTTPEELADRVHRFHYFLAPSIDPEVLARNKAVNERQRQWLLRQGASPDLLGPEPT